MLSLDSRQSQVFSRQHQSPVVERAMVSIALAVFGALISVGASQAPTDPPRKVHPIEESSSDPSFAAFKASLLVAAEHGNLTALKAAMAPNVKYHDIGSPVAVVRALKLREGAPWRALARAFTLGVARQRGPGPTFVAPYTYADRFEVDVDEIVIVGSGVNVRDSPSAQGRIVDKLSYDVVKISGASTRDDWIGIITPAGKHGWVRMASTDLSAELQFYFERIRGEWKIVIIAAGRD
jgi:hypothetical protein